MRDMTERDIFGAEKYGVRLQPGNGRDFLVDAYQEALDLVAYLRGAIYERDQLATADKFAAMQSELPASFGQQNMIDPADVEIGEDPLACAGCYQGCFTCAGREPAAAIDDESPRAAIIGQGGEMAAEVYAAVDAVDPWKGAPEWAKYKAQDADGEWYFYELEPHIDSGADQWYSEHRMIKTAKSLTFCRQR